MKSRVQSFSGHRFALPAGLGGVAARSLADRHQPCRATRFRSQLQPPSDGQGQGSFRFGDHQPGSARAQALLDRVERVGLVGGSDQMQPCRHAVGQRPRHRQVRGMGG